jgi:hypothetical protein
VVEVGPCALLDSFDQQSRVTVVAPSFVYTDFALPSPSQAQRNHDGNQCVALRNVTGAPLCLSIAWMIVRRASVLANAAGISTKAIWACHRRVPKGSHETKIEEMRLYEDPDSF